MRRIVFVALSAAFFFVVNDAHAQDSPPALDAGADALTPPVLRSQEEAVYPEDALRNRVEGNVGLELTVDEEGHVTEARVTSAAGRGFDEAALAAVRRFVFEPARQGGKAIRS